MVLTPVSGGRTRDDLKQWCKLQPPLSRHPPLEVEPPWESAKLKGIAQKGVRPIDARNSQLDNDSNAAKTSVRAPGLSADEREHPFVRYSEPPKRGRKKGAARKMSKSVEKLFDVF